MRRKQAELKRKQHAADEEAAAQGGGKRQKQWWEQPHLREEGEERGEHEQADDDVEWYRQEVGGCPAQLGVGGGLQRRMAAAAVVWCGKLAPPALLPHLFPTEHSIIGGLNSCIVSHRLGRSLRTLWG